MSFQELQTVVLKRDLREQGLLEGDLGTVVHVHDADRLEVEFVTAAGSTRAVVSLAVDDVRAAEDEDLLSVRRPGRPA